MASGNSIVVLHLIFYHLEIQAILFDFIIVVTRAGTGVTHLSRSCISISLG
jgi:hypothetical protein